MWIALFTWLCSRWSTHLLSADTDSVFHILLGQLMLDQGALLQSEPTTWTYPDGHLSAHEWGAQVAMAAAYRLGGLAAVAVIISGTIASSFAVLTAWLQHARVRVPVAVLTLCSAALVSVIHLHARPHVLIWL